jgi:hypothetical protein
MIKLLNSKFENINVETTIRIPILDVDRAENHLEMYWLLLQKFKITCINDVSNLLTNYKRDNISILCFFLLND